MWIPGSWRYSLGFWNTQPWDWCRRELAEIKSSRKKMFSGGLLVSVEEALAEEILRELKAAGLPTRAAVIGRVTEKREKYLYAGRGIL